MTLFGSIGTFIKKSMSAGATGASALDYSMRSLETQAFLLNVKGQASALKDADTLSLLQNYLITEGDSENIAKLVTAAKLMQQQQATTQPTSINASNLVIH